MEQSTTELSPLIPSKSEKPLLTTPVKQHHPPSSPVVVTPDRINPLSRIRNRSSVLSFPDDGPGTDMGLDSDDPNLVGSRASNVQKSENMPPLLPKMCEMLCEVFNAVVSSIRVLRLKQWVATLAQLSRNIESLTSWRFTLHHLAQLKYIMPEVIVVEKVLVTDEVTSCMKEEVLILLEVNAVESDKNTEVSGRFSNLKRLFRTRITDYAATHPEVDDVQEGEIPFLFYKPNQEPEPFYKPKRKGEPSPFSMNENETPVLSSAAHIPPTFKSSYSSRTFSAESFDSSPAKPLACLSKTPVKEVTSALFEDVSVSSTVDTDATPLKVGSKPAEFSSTPANCAATPAKLVSTLAEVVSTPDRLMAATPSLPTPKRALIIDDGDNKVNQSAKRRVIFDDANEQLSQVGEDGTDK